MDNTTIDTAKSNDSASLPIVKTKAKVKAKKRNTKALKADNNNQKNLIDCYMFPNAKKGELEFVNFMLNDKLLTFKANKATKINMYNITGIADNIKKLFEAIKFNTEKFCFAYRNTFWAFGLTDKVTTTSWKGCFYYANHKKSQIVINANRHFSFAHIIEVLNKANIVFTAHVTYCLVTVTDTNFKKLVPVCNALLK